MKEATVGPVPGMREHELPMIVPRNMAGHALRSSSVLFGKSYSAREVVTDDLASRKLSELLPWSSWRPSGIFRLNRGTTFHTTYM
jgi:hypothetical protein